MKLSNSVQHKKQTNKVRLISQEKFRRLLKDFRVHKVTKYWGWASCKICPIPSTILNKRKKEDDLNKEINEENQTKIT